MSTCDCRTIAEFRAQFRKTEPDKDARKCCSCLSDKKKIWRNVIKFLPIYGIMKKYNWKVDFLADIICGLTVGIMQLPQGMAYAMLAEMPPVVGLYMSFFPVLAYFIFGSSKHVSMGTVAVVSLLTGSVLARFDPAEFNTSPTSSLSTTNSSQDDLQNITTTLAPPSTLSLATKVGVVTTLSLLVGFLQILMGFFRLGFVTTYMSDPLIAGFTTATAIHVGTSQVKYILGIKIPRTDGLFQVIKTYIYIFERLEKTSIATLLVSIICMIVLYIVKEQINQRFKAKLKIPVPIELIVVVIGTAVSFVMNFKKKYKMSVVGEVPAGLPEPTLPSFIGLDKYIADIPIIAVISFAQSVSLAAILAKKNKYTIDANQELIAYGAGNVFGAFFSCYPYAASVSRSSVQESAGGKTQLASVFSAGLVLVVILWLGPLFESLPNCALSAIIVVALKSLIMQLTELPKVWKTSKYDFYIWVVTLLAATLLHVDYGLVIGLVFSFFTVVLRTQMAKPSRLGKVADQGVYKDPKVYEKTYQHSLIKVVGYNYPIYYANGELFVREVYRLAAAKPEVLRKQIRRAAAKMSQSNLQSVASLTSVVNMGSENTLVQMPRTESQSSIAPQSTMPEVYDINPFVFETPLTHIIIDLSAVAFVDSVGCKVIKTLIQDYDSVKVKVYFANISDDIWNIFETTEILPKYQNIMFLTLEDAYTAAMNDGCCKEVHDNQQNQVSFM